MNDSRLFTDFRSSNVREELFKQQNNMYSENDIRDFRTENSNNIADNDWNLINKFNGCEQFKRKQKCIHNARTTKVSTKYNIDELHRYNNRNENVLNVSNCETYCDDYRMIHTPGSFKNIQSCKNKNSIDPSIKTERYFSDRNSRTENLFQYFN
jgi:hypothetical protein